MSDVIIEPKSKSYTISHKYTNRLGMPDSVQVILEINYLTGRYSIMPDDHSTAKYFLFSNTSENHDIWKAVLKCIDSAIDFANKELGNDTTDSDDTENTGVRQKDIYNWSVKDWSNGEHSLVFPLSEEEKRDIERDRDNKVKLLDEAMEAIDMYLNSGAKRDRKEASILAKKVYEQYHGKPYVNTSNR